MMSSNTGLQGQVNCSVAGCGRGGDAGARRCAIRRGGVTAASGARPTRSSWCWTDHHGRDLSHGPETYEDEPVTSLGLFQPVLAAIIDGRVITRSWRTAATDTLARIETIVSDAEHNVLWQRSRSVVPADRLRQSDFVVYDHCYAPYVRGA